MLTYGRLVTKNFRLEFLQNWKSYEISSNCQSVPLAPGSRTRQERLEYIRRDLQPDQLQPKGGFATAPLFLVVVSPYFSANRGSHGAKALAYE
jgi:hypothetical protein